MERFGIHRSVDPPGVLPQAARVLDQRLPLRPTEIAIDVEYLNIDSASWLQLRESCSDDPKAMARTMLEIVAARGKMHNPHTGSGGMLVGTVTGLGSTRSEPEVGTRIASLVSLTLTPLELFEVEDIDPASAKVPVRGRAILFESSIYAPMPDDLPDIVALGVLDVCGAPAWIARVAEQGTNVVVMGAGGRSGLLSCAQALRSVGSGGRVLGLCWPEDTVVAAKEIGAEAVAVDCTDPVAVVEAVSAAFGSELADLVAVCTNVEGCEGGAILACKPAGRILFFSMSTSFTAAALSAEGVGKDCQMTIGSGFVPGHAELALDLVRTEQRLLERFSR